VPAAEPGLVESGLAEPALADWTDPVAAPDRSGLADPLGVVEPDPWSDRAAVFPGYAAEIDPACRDPAARPDHAGSGRWSARAASAPGYAAGTDPPCPAARPVRADFGALGLWSLLSGRAAIGPVAFLAGPAGIDPGAATIATFALGRRCRVARPAWFGLTRRQRLPTAQPY